MLSKFKAVDFSTILYPPLMEKEEANVHSDEETGAGKTAGEGKESPSPRITNENSNSPRLQELLDLFTSWLYMPDPSPIIAVLATIAVHPTHCNPVWLVMVGPSSSGKSQIMDSLSKLDHIHELSTVSPAALLSGTSAKEVTREGTGGVLRQLCGPPGNAGILLFKDLTSLLCMPHEELVKSLAALREVSDGKWDRPVGTDGARVLHWHGKASMVGCCTPMIDKHQGIIASCGERMLYCRIPESDRFQQAQRAWDNSTLTLEMKTQLSDAVREFFDGLPPVRSTASLPVSMVEQLIAMAVFISAARSSVERASYSHEIILRGESDGPARLTHVFAALLCGMLTIGASPDNCWRILGKVALDSIPAIRRSVITYLSPRYGSPVTTRQVAESVGYSPTVTRRVLEDLEVHGITGRERNGADYWSMTPQAWDGFVTGFPYLI